MKRPGKLRPRSRQLTATGDGAADSPCFLSTRDGQDGSASAAEPLTNVYGVNTQSFSPYRRTNRDQDHRGHRGQGLALQQQTSRTAAARKSSISLLRSRIPLGSRATLP